MLNLILNAIDASQGGEQVLVNATAVNGSIAIESGDDSHESRLPFRRNSGSTRVRDVASSWTPAELLPDLLHGIFLTRPQRFNDALGDRFGTCRVGYNCPSEGAYGSVPPQYL
jgi:hypothetical protein